jgi:CIC family chloride channel protein
MRAATEILAAQMTVGEALEKTQSSEFRSWPVTDERGVVGIVSRSSLQHALAEGAATRWLTELVDSRDFPHVHRDQSLHLALERMGAAQLDVLPVVSRADVHKLEGIVTLQDVLDSYGVGPIRSD